MRVPGGRAVPKGLFGARVAAICLGVTGAAVLTGHWRNRLSAQDYQELLRMREGPAPGIGD